jgi:hypothetical protein
MDLECWPPPPVLRVRTIEAAMSDFCNVQRFVLFYVRPAAVGELQDKHLAGAREDDGRLDSDHADVLVALHDFLDASE